MEEIIEALHIKYQLPKASIRAICESPFRFLTENMRQATLKTIQFMYFGKFAVHRIKREKFQKMNEERIKNGEVRESKRDLPRLEKPGISKSRDRKVSQSKVRDMLRVSIHE